MKPQHTHSTLKYLLLSTTLYALGIASQIPWLIILGFVGAAWCLWHVQLQAPFFMLLLSAVLTACMWLFTWSGQPCPPAWEVILFAPALPVVTVFAVGLYIHRAILTPLNRVILACLLVLCCVGLYAPLLSSCFPVAAKTSLGVMISASLVLVFTNVLAQYNSPRIGRECRMWRMYTAGIFSGLLIVVVGLIKLFLL